MAIQFACFPGGLHKALTLSFDDGKVADRRLVGKFNEYGLRGTFHLNSGFLGKERYIAREEVSSLYQGHEVSAHTCTHPFLQQSPNEQIAAEILEDRKALEALTGYPVRGMSYPFGKYNDRVLGMLPSLGIEYARTVDSHGRFELPANLLRWDPTCHHKQMVDNARSFLEIDMRFPRMHLFYVWGHSYEFDKDDNWELVDRFGEMMAGRGDIWYATNAEIVSYMDTIKRLRFSADCGLVHNPSALSAWIHLDGEPLEIPPGRIVQLR